MKLIVGGFEIDLPKAKAFRTEVELGGIETYIGVYDSRGGTIFLLTLQENQKAVYDPITNELRILRIE